MCKQSWSTGLSSRVEDTALCSQSLLSSPLPLTNDAPVTEWLNNWRFVPNKLVSKSANPGQSVPSHWLRKPCSEHLSWGGCGDRHITTNKLYATSLALHWSYSAQPAREKQSRHSLWLPSAEMWCLGAMQIILFITGLKSTSVLAGSVLLPGSAI